MKKLSSIIVLSSVLFSSCSIDWNDKKEQKITELEKQISELRKEAENDLFEKNKECSQFYENIKDEEAEFVYEKSFSDIESVFYSHEKNSCLYALHRYDTDNGFNWFLIYNYFSKELVYTSGLIDISKENERYYNEELSWKEKIKDLESSE